MGRREEGRCHGAAAIARRRYTLMTLLLQAVENFPDSATAWSKAWRSTAMPGPFGGAVETRSILPVAPRHRAEQRRRIITAAILEHRHHPLDVREDQGRDAHDKFVV